VECGWRTNSATQPESDYGSSILRKCHLIAALNAGTPILPRFHVSDGFDHHTTDLSYTTTLVPDIAAGSTLPAHAIFGHGPRARALRHVPQGNDPPGFASAPAVPVLGGLRIAASATVLVRATRSPYVTGARNLRIMESALRTSPPWRELEQVTLADRQLAPGGRPPSSSMRADRIRGIPGNPAQLTPSTLRESPAGVDRRAGHIAGAEVIQAKAQATVSRLGPTDPVRWTE